MQSRLDEISIEVWEQIASYLSPKEVNSLSHVCSFFRNTLNKHKQRLPEHVRHNMAKQQFGTFQIVSKEERGQKAKHIFTYLNLVIAVYQFHISAWNRDTGALQWRKELEIWEIYCGSIWLVDGKFVYAGMMHKLPCIQVVDARTGKVDKILQENLCLGSVNVLNNIIIAKLTDGTVKFWNSFNLEFIDHLQIHFPIDKSSNAPHYSSFFAFENYLIDVDRKDKYIIIYDLATNQYSQMDLPPKHSISGLYHYKDKILIATISTMSAPNSPNMVLIDIESKKIIQSFIRDRNDTFSCSNIVHNGEQIFLSFQLGAVYAADKATGKLIPIMDTKLVHPPIWLHGNYLFVPEGRYEGSDQVYTQIHIFDTNTLKEIGCLDDLMISNMSYAHDELTTVRYISYKNKTEESVIESYNFRV